MSLLSKNLESMKAASGYKFSATKVNALLASEYTLATLTVDYSYSVKDYILQLEQAITAVVKGLRKSPRVDNLLFRLVRFSDAVEEVHGFKLLKDIKEDTDYNGCLTVGGNTALFEAMDESVQASTAYGKTLLAKEFNAVNAINFTMTDGQSNRGTIREPEMVAKSVEAARKAECLESIQNILIGVTALDDPDDMKNLDYYLTEVKDKAGIDQYVSIGQLNPGRLAKLAKFVSQSVSSTSQALGTGKASTPLSPTPFNF